MRPAIVLATLAVLIGLGPAPLGAVTWTHLSSHGDGLPLPNSGNQQTATAVFDVDNDGDLDFLVAERTAAPAVVWYRRSDRGWLRYVVEAGKLRIEAGAAWTDIDNDGDTDVVFGGDSGSNGLWWWENPCPDFRPGQQSWRRHTIKNGGATKHHDQLFVDCDGDGRQELVFWNQNARILYLAEIPADPTQEPWDCVPIYTYSERTQPPQRGTYPNWKGINEHEGLAAGDIDGDGVTDIVGGGCWFKHLHGTVYQVHLIDASYAFTRAAVGDFIAGGRPEVVLVVGDGRAPLLLYEWQAGSWQSRVLVEAVQDGHSLAVIDFNGDGHLDIFNAEMRLGGNPQAVTRLLLGDGRGHFTDQVVHRGFGLHESRIADLDNDGDLDILGKPYTWQAPRLDLWLQE